MSRYGLIGHRLGHSYSPLIHRKLFCPDYSLIELEPENLAEFFSKREFGAVNVTIPYKQDVMAFCDEIEPGAAKIGAVNTIVNKKGRLIAYNTDIDGFCGMVRHAGVSMAGKKVLILGSGGAAKAVHAGAAKLGASEIVIVSRRGKNNYENIGRHYSDTDIIVNTTPVGMYPNCPESVISLKKFSRLCAVFDVVYNPALTGILLQAESLGIKFEGGLRMLVEQAIAAEEFFLGQKIDRDFSDQIVAMILQQTLNIVLIGMPGSGKTTIGQKLALANGRTFVDLDEEIVKKASMSIPEIFSGHGQGVFRKLETETAAEFGKRSGLVISCGGGIVTRKENYPLLHQNSIIYRLTRSLEKLPLDGRPLSSSIEALRSMEIIRDPLYKDFADVTVDNNGELSVTINNIWRDFCENSCH